jgi:glycosyltransferase involved in cell wall biosynthesis
MSEPGNSARATPARRDATPSISCILPAFNEGESLPALLTQLSDELRRHFARWEIVVVNDGSSDDTEIAMLPWLRGRNVRYVSLSRNFGKEAALTAGLDRARGDLVLLMDADLQHPPALIPDMLAAWRKNRRHGLHRAQTRGDDRC